MKSILFGLTLLAALPGCCDWCKKKDKCDKPYSSSKKMVTVEEDDMSMNGNRKMNKEMKSSKSYSKK
jgi:hypothetical protein